MASSASCPRCPGPRVPHRCGLCPSCPGPTVPHHCRLLRTGRGALGLSAAFGATGKGRAPGRPLAASAGGQAAVGKSRGQAQAGAAPAAVPAPPLPRSNLAKGKASAGKGKGSAAGSTPRERWVIQVATPNRGSILGNGGENFKYIEVHTGVRLALERVPGASEDLQVCIDGCRGESFNEAVRLVHELLKAVDEEAAKRAAERTASSRDRRYVPPHARARDDQGRFEALRPQRPSQRPPRAAGRGSGKGCSQEDREELRDHAAAKLAEAEELRQAMDTLQQQMAQLREAGMRDEVEDMREISSQLAQRVRALEQEAESLGELSLSKAAGESTGAGRIGGFCALFPLGACPFEDGKCPRGAHGEPPVPSEDGVLVRTTRAKRGLLQQKWEDAGGQGQLVDAWQVRNPRLDLLLRATESDFAATLGLGSDIIDGWHGTREENVLSIAVNGFDPKRRCGQAYGAGEYFAKDPNVSIGYAQGGAFMFLCKLVLGQEELDHRWVPGPNYYVLAQRDRRIQAVPLFLVQFQASASPLAQRLGALVACEDEEPMVLAARQPGALRPCEARRDAGMTADSTRHLWVGWLSPSLRTKDDDAVAADVEAFLEGHAVEQVIPERNGARVGAFVLLREDIGQLAFRELQRRPYAGKYRISVDDNQPANPRCGDCVCPRLRGPSRYCRGWNIRGHKAWQWGCSYAHPENLRPTHNASYRLEALPMGSAKFDEIHTEFMRSAPFFSADGSCGTPSIVAVRRVDNPALARAYEERRGFLHDKQGFAMEKELWHGTSCKAIPELLLHGLQPPSDTRPSGSCPVSGGKGLCTTLCGTGCKHCTEAHTWGKCHMYGLGVYLADQAQKSHRYVREPARLDGVPTPQGRASSAPVYSMVRCRVVLGNPYLIEGNLLQPDAMHDMCWCQNPSEAVESCSEHWSVAKGHDAFYVRGQAGAEKAGLGVYNSEYIVFHPYQILPLYQVDYVLE